jgi:hypothetical protein
MDPAKDGFGKHGQEGKLGAKKQLAAILPFSYTFFFHQLGCASVAQR